MMEEGKKKIVKKIEETLEKVVESVASKEVITFKTKLSIVIIQQRKITKKIIYLTNNKGVINVQSMEMT